MFSWRYSTLRQSHNIRRRGQESQPLSVMRTHPIAGKRVVLNLSLGHWFKVSGSRRGIKFIEHWPKRHWIFILLTGIYILKSHITLSWDPLCQQIPRSRGEIVLFSCAVHTIDRWLRSIPQLWLSLSLDEWRLLDYSVNNHHFVLISLFKLN